MRNKAKENDISRKEENQREKTKQHADRIQIVSSEMLRTNRLNGGSFPNPGLGFQEVSTESGFLLYFVGLLLAHYI